MTALPIDPTDQQLMELAMSAPTGYGRSWRALFQAGVEAERARAAAETTEAPKYRFTGRFTGRDPEGYYHPRWDQAQSVVIVAADKDAAWKAAIEMLGTHPRFGSRGSGRFSAVPGWTGIWDTIEQVQS